MNLKSISTNMADGNTQMYVNKFALGSDNMVYHIIGVSEDDPKMLWVSDKWGGESEKHIDFFDCIYDD